MKKFIIPVAVLLLGSGLAIGWNIAGDEVREIFGNDPDRPPGAQGDFNEAEYIINREQWVARIRGIDPERPAAPDARNKAVRQMEKMEERRSKAGENSSSRPEAATAQSWVEIGPNPIPNGQTQTTASNVSGRVSAIEIDPTDPNKVFVGTAQGGIYRSLDGGATWTPIFDNAQTLAIGSLTLDAANKRLWVGTGEANGSADSFAGVGLYRIDNPNSDATLVGPINPLRSYMDASNNPQNVAVFTGRSISKILIVPNDPNTLFVGNAGGVIGLGGNAPFGGTVPPAGIRGLYKLTNVGGAPASVGVTRIPIRSGAGIEGCFDTPCTGNRNINDMVFDLSDPTGNTLVVWLNGTNAANDAGVWRSTNAMSAAPTFAQKLATTSTTTGNSRGIFAQRPSNASLIYVASGEPSTQGSLCNSGTNFGGLRRSTDGGETWTNQLPGGGGFCAGQCFYNLALDIVPGATSATDKVLIGGNVRSTSCAKLQGTSLDGGATAFANTDVGVHADSHVIKISPSDVNIVYRGDDGGIWKSVDGGATWTSLNNTTFRATQFQSIAVHPTDPKITLGGTQDNGTERMDTNGNWSFSDGGDGGFVLIDQSNPLTVYHTYFNQTGSQIGFQRSVNGGASWPTNLRCSGTGTSNGISCNDAVNFYAPAALGPGSPNTLYIGTDRLYRSATQGTANAVVSQAPIQTGVPISGIGISQLDDNYRVVGLNNGAIWYTTTGSSTLTLLDPTGTTGVIPDFYVSRIVFDPVNKNTAYITLGNFGNGTAATQSHVWKITNLDTIPVKTPLNGTGLNILPDVPVNAFAINPDNPSTLYLGTDIGVFTSADGGLNWTPMGSGLPRVAVFDMAITAKPRKLRIATHGRGMWDYNLVTTRTAAVDDFNGDGRTDIGVVRSQGGSLTWFINNLVTGTAADHKIEQFGNSTDTPQAADYDGDGKADIAVWRPGAADVGAFYILKSSTNSLQTELFGVTGDDAKVAGDYDGDGKADVAVYRAGTQSSPQSYFFYRGTANNPTRGITYIPWGAPGDVPIPGDYDGDGKSDFVVKRTAGTQAQFWRRMTTAPSDIQYFGVASDTAVPGDFDGDGTTDLAVVRNEGGRLGWYYKPSSNPLIGYYYLGQWGVPGDIISQGDYDGDGKTDQAIFRPNADPQQNYFWINRTTSGLLLYEWGAQGDQPVTSYNTH